MGGGEQSGVEAAGTKVKGQLWWLEVSQARDRKSPEAEDGPQEHMAEGTGLSLRSWGHWFQKLLLRNPRMVFH